MSATFLQLLQEERRTEINKGSKRHNFVNFFPEIPKSHTVMYTAADCCSQTDTVTVMFSVLLHSTFTVQIL